MRHSALLLTCPQEEINNYTCACVAGWIGKNCDEDIDECKTGVCKNTAQCMVNPK